MLVLREQLKDSGMDLIEEEEIGANVLKALDADNERKLKLMGNRIPKILSNSFMDFAGIRGYKIWASLKSGATGYLRAVLRKPNN